MVTVIKETDLGKKADKGTRPATAAGAGEAADVPERWSAPRKTELVMRLLRGEGLDAVARDSQVPGHALEGWKRVFLEHGARGLKRRVEPEERDLTLARAKIRELIMRLELAECLIEKRGLADEWKKSKR